MANQLNNSNNYIKVFDAATTADEISDGYARDMYALHAVQTPDADGSNTFDIEGSIDGSNWIKIGSTISAAGITQVTGLYRFLRIHRQSGTSALTVILFSADRLRK